jgi:hypothetical protein
MFKLQFVIRTMRTFLDANKQGVTCARDRVCDRGSKLRSAPKGSSSCWRFRRARRLTGRAYASEWASPCSTGSRHALAGGRPRSESRRSIDLTIAEFVQAMRMLENVGFVTEGSIEDAWSTFAVGASTTRQSRTGWPTACPFRPHLGPDSGVTCDRACRGRRVRRPPDVAAVDAEVRQRGAV